MSLLFDASWPVPPGVRAVCSTREGGVSRAPYGSLNLGDHVGDDAQAVAANRERFAGALGARPVFLNQVHGIKRVELDADTSDATEADACFTTRRKLACTIMVADCLPVLFCNTAGTMVGAAHAGWRGLAGGVLEAALDGFEPATTLAWLGPCIGPTVFEVGPEVKAAFESQDSRSGEMFKPYKEGKWLADLPGLARQRLRALGITQIYGNDGSTAWCTASNPSRFFSHRRDRVSGRMAASIWLE